MATLLYHYLSLLVVFQLALSKAVTTLSPHEPVEHVSFLSQGSPVRAKANQEQIEKKSTKSSTCESFAANAAAGERFVHVSLRCRLCMSLFFAHALSSCL